MIKFAKNHEESIFCPNIALFFHEKSALNTRRSKILNDFDLANNLHSM